MKNRTIQVLLLALTGVAATAHCGKGGESSGTPSLGPTDVVVTWTFSGAATSPAACTMYKGQTVRVTVSATNDPALHQDATAACEKGTVTFSALDTGGLGMPFVEGALLDDKGVTITHAEITAPSMAGKTAVTLDFFPISMTTSGDPATTSGDPSTAASSGGGGMGGMGATSASSAASSSAAASTSAATTAGAGGASGASSSSTGP
ncbi:MAG: hypothetical protein ABJE95_02730 [Byssovorax sp.]